MTGRARHRLASQVRWPVGQVYDAILEDLLPGEGQGGPRGAVGKELAALAQYHGVDKQVQVVATSDPSWHQPIEYWGVVVADSKHAAAARKFLVYLQTEKAQAIFQSHGFVKPTTAPAK